MSEEARSFLKRLEFHEASISEEVGHDQVGLGLITALKEFDYYHYNLVRNERADDADLHFNVLRLGLPRTIKEILSRVPFFKYPVVTFQSNKELILAALDATAGFGFIETGRRLAHAALAGECHIRIIRDDSFEILLPKKMFALEYHEQLIEQHYRDQYRINMNASIAKTFSKRTQKRIAKLLSKNVYIFGKYFIGYGAHPDLDDYFFGFAYAQIMNHSGFDEFHHRLTFGGVSFHKYVLSATYMLSLAIRHERFCEALIQKEPQIRLRDILTITCDKQEFRESLVEVLNHYGPSFENFTPVTSEDADTILKVMTVRRDNLKILEPTMAPVPFLVEFSDSALIKCCACAQIGPMDFLLNSLRYNFQKDYDRNQQTREQSMRLALKRIISEIIPDLTFIDAVKIRKDGRILTDIDCVVIEPSSGAVLLIQLKHQDHYGADIRRRSNRSGKLKKEVASWLNTIRDWAQTTARPEMSSALRLAKTVPIHEIRMLVLTKHFAYSLSELDMLDDCAYATWVQFVDAITRIHNDKHKTPTLLELFSVLRDTMSHKAANIVTVDSDDVFHIRSLKFRIRQI
ncbi:hypothetical protein B5P46_28015 [Rhizobium leguminosarum]|uniref:Uncharacterized protein n=1 Tax=Rhizobium leguminosarum TaxID=384 RepID=A0A4Q1TKK3_RHILE|nr:hypothetical protein [Rhizobium leguminosarum]RXT18743.1 hypothetical protein B5P46_28015 [Rhizobium leguminosarum]